MAVNSVKMGDKMSFCFEKNHARRQKVWFCISDQPKKRNGKIFFFKKNFNTELP